MGARHEETQAFVSVAFVPGGAAEPAGGHTLQMDGAPDFEQGTPLLAEPDSLRDGQRLAGRYRVVRELGRGGFGIVYEAFDESPLQRAVALKVIRLAGAEDASRHQRLRAQFMAEARTAGNLSHPNVATVYDVGEADGTVFMTQQLVRGKDLRQILSEEGALPLRRAFDLVRQLCEGVAHAHERGIIHRDLKPANILVDASGQARVTDFGLAQAAQREDGDRSGAIIGTPGYMAPEQFRGERCAEAADIFAIGCIFYSLLTGRSPFQGPTLAAVADATVAREPVAVRELRPEVPRGIERLIGRALKKAPADRYPSVRDLLADLGRPFDRDPVLEPGPAIEEIVAFGLDRVALVVGPRTVADDRLSRVTVEARIADRLAAALPSLPEGLSLPRLAQQVEAELGRGELFRHLEASLASLEREPDPVALALAAVPVQNILTTRWDPLLGRLPPVEAGPQGRQVLQLFGSAEDPTTLLVTEDDLWSLFADGSPRTQAARAALEGRLVVIAGYSASDEVFQQLCQHVIRCRPGRPAPVFLVVEGAGDPEVTWCERRGVRLVEDRADRFLRRLGQVAQGRSLDSALRSRGSMDTLQSVHTGLMGSLDAPPTASLARCVPVAPPARWKEGLAWGGRVGVALAIALGTAQLWTRHMAEAPLPAPAAEAPVVAAAPAAAPAPAPASEEFVLVVAPFWGLGAQAIEEGKVMQVLAEREVNTVLAGTPGVKILGKEVSDAPRSHVEARALAERLGASAVLWGEVLILGDTLEFQPYVTHVRKGSDSRDHAAVPIQVGLSSSDQLRMRKVKAEELGTLGLFVAGQFFLDRDPPRALELFARVQPATAEAVGWQGEALLRQGRFQQAETVLNRAQALDPRSSFVMARMGWLRWYQGRLDEALVALRTAAELEPGNACNHLDLAMLLESQGHFDEAMVHFRRAREIDPSLRRHHQALVNALVRNRSFEEAFKEAEAVRLTSIGDAFYYELVAHIHLEMGEGAKGEEVLRSAMAAAPDDLDLLLALAWNTHNRDKPETAQKLFEQVLARQPDNISALMGSALVHEFRGENEDSLRLYARAEELAPQDFGPRASRARVLGKVGKNEESIKVLQEALRRGPPPTSIGPMHMSMGGAYARLGRYDEAVEELQQAVALMPASGPTHMLLGVILEEAGRLEDASQVYRDASKVDLYIESYLPLFAYLVDGRLGKQAEALALLKTQRQKVEAAGLKVWPLPVFQFLTGELGEQDLLTRAKEASEAGAPEPSLQQLEAWYYIGMKARLEGRNDEAIVWLTKLDAHNSDALFEHRAGRAELKRIKLTL